MFGIYDIFKWQGINFPDKTALVCDDKRYTYRQLNRRINSIAYGLNELGVGKGTQLGLMLYNGVDYVTAFFAGIKLGACICPLDYRWQPDELLQEIAAIKCRYFIIENDITRKIDELYPEKFDCVKTVTVQKSKYSSIEDYLENGHEDWEFTEKLSEDDPIFTIFTGGTTGLPKAAIHTQQGTLVRVLGLLSNPDLINRNDIYLNYAPMFHLGGIGAMLNIFAAGATFVLISGFSPESIVDTIVREKVTYLTLLPPTIINRLKDVRDNGFDISSVRVLQLAGGSCTDATLETAFELMPQVLCVNIYGNSENAICISHVFNKEQFYADRSTTLLLGKPETYYEAKIVDEEGNEVPVGKIGEAYGRSPEMMAGFVGRPNPFTDDGWYPTGDLMYKDENGNYHFCARSKDMIKSGGENVFADEVESAITRENDNVLECAVIGLPHEEWGEIVTAAVVLRQGKNMTEKEIIDHCKRYIASYKKPKKVFFLTELPKSSVGKVLKSMVKQQLLDLQNTNTGGIKQ